MCQYAPLTLRISMQSTAANCAARSHTPLGSSKAYPPTISSLGYEGGNGFASGNKTLTAWADWAFAYVKVVFPFSP